MKNLNYEEDEFRRQRKLMSKFDYLEWQRNKNEMDSHVWVATQQIEQIKLEFNAKSFNTIGESGKRPWPRWYKIPSKN